MKALAGGQFPATATGDLHLDHCLGCRRCEAVCPADVQYGALLTGSRALQAERAPPGWRRRMVLGLLARPALLSAGLGGYRRLFSVIPGRWRLLPKPPFPRASFGPIETVDSADSAEIKEAAVFTGCIAMRYEAPARLALERLLLAAGIRVRGAAGQTCCGAAALHAGVESQAAVLARANRDAFAGAGTVLCLASGCQETLGHSLAGVAEVRDAVELLESRADRLRFGHAGGRRVALHLPCTQQAVTGTAPALRRLLARIPGLQVVELPDTGCCGAAGLHQLEEPARAAALRAPLLGLLANCGAGEVLSSNIGCRLHLAPAVDLPVRHPLELIAEYLQ
jgi:glycolate oxidase iron-sulfur subunit